MPARFKSLKLSWGSSSSLSLTSASLVQRRSTYLCSEQPTKVAKPSLTPLISPASRRHAAQFRWQFLLEVLVAGPYALRAGRSRVPGEIAGALLEGTTVAPIPTRALLQMMSRQVVPGLLAAFLLLPQEPIRQ